MVVGLSSTCFLPEISWHQDIYIFNKYNLVNIFTCNASGDISISYTFSVIRNVNKAGKGYIFTNAGNKGTINAINYINIVNILYIVLMTPLLPTNNTYFIHVFFVVLHVSLVLKFIYCRCKPTGPKLIILLILYICLCFLITLKCLRLYSVECVDD
jgi:hypothetical protein